MVSMVVGAAVRFDIPRGLWLDEAISVSVARMPYGAMIHRLATADNHPPLYFTALWGSIRLVGQSEVALRVPSILFGMLLIPLVYLLGKEAYDRKTGAVAAIFVSVAPFAVWYSQEVRPYELLMVFGVLALWAQLRILRRGGWYPWVVFSVAVVAMVGTQYFGVWQLAVQELVFVGAIVLRWRRHQRPGALLRGWVSSTVPVALALVPLALLMKQQYSADQATGQAFGGAASVGINTGSHSIYSVITNFGYSIIGFHSTSVMSEVNSFWPLAMLGALALLGRRSKPVTYLLVAMVAVPVTLMFVLAGFKGSLGDVRYLSTTVPVLLLLMARAGTVLATSRRALNVVVVGVVAVMAVGLFDQQFSSSNPRRYNFREALARVNSHARPGDIILYDPVDDELNTVVDYYSPHVRSAPLSPGSSVKAGHTVFVVASPTLMNTSDRSTLYSGLSHLGEHGHRIEHWVFPNVEVWVYR